MLAEHLIRFRNEFNKLNNTGAQMLNSIYLMTLKLFSIHILWRKNAMVLPYTWR